VQRQNICASFAEAAARATIAGTDMIMTKPEFFASGIEADRRWQFGCVYRTPIFKTSTHRLIGRCAARKTRSKSKCRFPRGNRDRPALSPTLSGLPPGRRKS
jgi:hypothetical protein